jgi:surfeit locus 1 family protein
MKGGRAWTGAMLLLASVLAVGLTLRLGLWQLDRAAQKQALQAQIDAQAARPPLDTAELARAPAQAQAQHYRAARLQGRWLPQHTVFLDNRQMRGRPGFFVVTPLQLADGSAVLVQRGWVARDPAERARLPAVPTPLGEILVQGRVAPPPSRLFEFESAQSGVIRQNLDLAAFAAETRLQLRPLSMQQTLGAQPDDGLLRDWPQVLAQVDKHHGYAFQWFALAALIAGLYVWFQLLRPRRELPRAHR